MRMDCLWKCAIAIVAIGAAPLSASAQEATVVIEEDEEPFLSVQGGGGLHGYIGTEMGANTDVGGGWEARATILPAAPIAWEVAYIGALNPVDVPDLENPDALVASNSAEALIRANVASILGAPQLGNVELEPFVAAGLSYTNLQLTGNDLNAPEVESVFEPSADVFGIPAAIGLHGMVNDDLSLGARVAYNVGFDNDLTVDDADGTLQSWRATADLGYAF